MNLKDLLTRHEGRRPFPYTDTRGLLTIGIGHNLTWGGISDAIIDALLVEDTAAVEAQLREREWFVALLEYGGEVRADAIRDLAFNVGARIAPAGYPPIGIDKFVHMIAAIRLGDWETAAKEIENSTIAPGRAADLAHMMRTGEYPA